MSQAKPDAGQLRYAKVTQWGARIGLALLIASYIALLAGFASAEDMGVMAIGWLSAISIAGLIAVLPRYLSLSDYGLAAICGAQALLLIAAALGVFTGGF